MVDKKQSKEVHYNLFFKYEQQGFLLFER